MICSLGIPNSSKLYKLVVYLEETQKIFEFTKDYNASHGRDYSEVYCIDSGYNNIGGGNRRSYCKVHPEA